MKRWIVLAGCVCLVLIGCREQEETKEAKEHATLLDNAQQTSRRNEQQPATIGAADVKPMSARIEGSTEMAIGTRGSTVTANRLWKCPKCGKVLEKGDLGKYWNPGDPITRVAGNATCGSCISRFDQADVYGGMYDVEENAQQHRQADFRGIVSVITYQLSSTTPPGNAEDICENLLRKRHPNATLGRFYCVGRTDSQLTPDEGLVLYKEYLKEGKLPDLGTQFDNFTGIDMSGRQVLVLFFKK